MVNLEKNKLFGQTVSRLINNENLNYAEAFQAFSQVLKNEVTEMQQGAFLAALTSKGETTDEIAGAWKAIYEYDTVKVELEDSDNIVENCGTGMDSFKTFNISTASAIVAAAGGVKIARHGARAISSVCGTVDIAEELGVDVECDAEIVVKSINKTGLGLFNGMSPKIHPLALGRILSQIHFGSPLNIAASLANPALPQHALRGVYNKDVIRPVIEFMKNIGYKNAIVLHGNIDDKNLGIDEASVCGTTYAAQLKETGEITEFSFSPESFGIKTHSSSDISADKDKSTAAKNMINLLSSKRDSARKDAVLLNTSLIFYTKGLVDSIEDGIEKAKNIIDNGAAFKKLEEWVTVQNVDSKCGLNKLHSFLS